MAAEFEFEFEFECECESVSESEVRVMWSPYELMRSSASSH